MTDKNVIYPRFIGVDGSADFVWELASGRWTWGETPYDAADRKRTFTPDRYVEKYGPVVPLESSDVVGHAPVPTDDPTMSVTDRKEGVSLALYTMLIVAKSWADGAAENDAASATRYQNAKPSDQQTFVLADIRNMVNDAARELGVSEFPLPEDQV